MLSYQEQTACPRTQLQRFHQLSFALYLYIADSTSKTTGQYNQSKP